MCSNLIYLLNKTRRKIWTTFPEIQMKMFCLLTHSFLKGSMNLSRWEREIMVWLTLNLTHKAIAGSWGHVNSASCSPLEWACYVFLWSPLFSQTLTSRCCIPLHTLFHPSPFGVETSQIKWSICVKPPRREEAKCFLVTAEGPLITCTHKLFF